MNADDDQVGVRGDAVPAGASRQLWRWLVPIVVVTVTLVLGVVVFGGSLYGGLLERDLEGTTYTITASQLPGLAVGTSELPATISFQHGSLTWDVGCTQTSREYQIVWSTLELTGRMTAGPARNCEPGGSDRDVALEALMLGRPTIRNQDDNRVIIEGPGGSLDLLEQS